MIFKGLCVGGPMDGKQFSNEGRVFLVPTLNRPPGYWRSDKLLTEEQFMSVKAVDVRNHVYKFVTLSPSFQDIDGLWVHESIHDEDPVHILLQGYPRQ